MSTRRPAAPAGATAEGKRLWNFVHDEYAPTEAETMLLRQVVREMAIVERLEQELDGAPLTVTGVRGAVVANPLLQEVRAHRVVIGQLLARLKLEPLDEEEPGQAPGLRSETAMSRSEAASKAARSRWGMR